MKRRWIIKRGFFIRDTDSVTERDKYVEIARNGELIATLRRDLVTYVDTM